MSILDNLEKNINEVVSHSERNFIDNSRGTDIQGILEKGGLDVSWAGFGGKEYLEFNYRGKRYEVIQVDQPEKDEERFQTK